MLPSFIGFTKWSATRTPQDVFVLLETLYGEFDAIARRRGVFKGKFFSMHLLVRVVFELAQTDIYCAHVFSACHQWRQLVIAMFVWWDCQVCILFVESLLYCGT